MVRYAQFVDLPCDPTPQQNVQYQDEYKNVAGMLSIKSLNTKIQPFFEEYLEETKKIYSLDVHGTQANFFFEKNKKKIGMQRKSIKDLTYISEFLTYKTQELKKLQISLKAGLEEQFRTFKASISEALNKIYSQYGQILKDQFSILKDQTQKQIKLIKTQLKRLQRQADDSILRRRKLNPEQAASIIGISKQQIHGYNILFKIVTEQTLEELQDQQRARLQRSIQIDKLKIKKITCHQLWYLMELIKKKKDQINNPANQGSIIFGAEEDRLDLRNLLPPTVIQEKEVINSFEQQTFRTETKIIDELSTVMNKKSRDGSLNASINDSMNSGIAMKLLTDFLKDKKIKQLMKSTESKIQLQFQNYNKKFKLGDYIQNIQAQRINEQQRRSLSPNDFESRKDPSPKNFKKPNSSRPSPLLTGGRIIEQKPYGQKGKQQQNVEFSFVRPGLNKDNQSAITEIDKLNEFKSNITGRKKDNPLFPKRENYHQDEFSQLNYDDESLRDSIARRKKDAQQQFNQYRQTMKKSRSYQTEKQRKQHEEELSRQLIKKLQEEQEQQRIEAHQRKLKRDQYKQLRQRQAKQKQKERQEQQEQKQRVRRKQIEYQEHLKQKQKQKERQKQRKQLYEKLRQKNIQIEKEKEKRERKEREKQLQKQRHKSMEKMKSRQLQQMKQAEQRERSRRQIQRDFKKLKQQKEKEQQRKRKFQIKDEFQPRPNYFKRDQQTQKIADEWKRQRQQNKENKNQQKKNYGGQTKNNIYQRRQNEFCQISNIPGVDMEEQFRLMQQIQNKKHKLPKPSENAMMKRFQEQMHVPRFGTYEDKREYQRPNKRNSSQEFGFGDHFREQESSKFNYENYRKQLDADDSLLKFALEESLHVARRQDQQKFNPNDWVEKKKGVLDFIKPVGKFIANTFNNVVVPNFKPAIERKLQETFDNTLIDFEQFLSGMGKKKQCFSLEENFKYDFDEIEAFEVFEGDEEEAAQTKIVPLSMGTSQGQLTIKQIHQNAQQLHNSKDQFSIFVKVLQPVLLTFKPRDRVSNRPMTKLIVGDSTGVAVLYMNYYFEVKAGCCLRLNNCRLHKYCQSFEINHHRNITITDNLRQEGSLIPRVDSNLMLSLIRKPQEGKYLYEVRPFFNHPLANCINQFSKSKITIGQITIRKPIIVTVCEVTSSNKCVLGDYTGKINADLSNLRKRIIINPNDTLLIRNAKMQLNRGAILLMADQTSVVVKADKGFKFSHDNRYIPDKILRGNS